MLIRQNSFRRVRPETHTKYLMLIFLCCCIIFYQHIQCNKKEDECAPDASADEENLHKRSISQDYPVIIPSIDTEAQTVGQTSSPATLPNNGYLIDNDSTPKKEAEKTANENLPIIERVVQHIAEAKNRMSNSDSVLHLTKAQNLLFGLLGDQPDNSESSQVPSSGKDVPMSGELDCDRDDHECKTSAVSKYIHIVLLSAHRTTTFEHLRQHIRRVYPSVNVSYARILNNELNKAPSLPNVLKHIDKPYTLLIQNLTRFDKITDMYPILQGTIHFAGNVHAVGGSYRLTNGYWFDGCSSMTMKNFILKFQSGYDRSAGLCIFCDHLEGPFLLSTKVAIEFFSQNKTHAASISDYFISQTRQGSRAIACTKTMFHAEISPLSSYEKGFWAPVARKYILNRIILPDRSEHKFTCAEIDVDASGIDFRKEMGLMIPLCLRASLTDLVHKIIRKMEEAGIRYEMTFGTTLGALKFKGILPWERDADFFFDAHNYTALKNLEPYFKSLGFEMVEDYPFNLDPYCSYFTRKPCASLDIFGHEWHAQFTGLYAIEAYNQYNEILPTRLPIEGMWIVTNINPLAYAQAFGSDMYSHCEHGWNRKQFYGKPTFCPKGGEFLPCARPGEHYCLDQYASTGNLQFLELD